MNILRKTGAISVLAFALSVSASAQEDLAGLQMLSVAKMAGACGILDSIIQFQKTTRLEGGDEFVTRFWSVEAARLGMSVQELSSNCNQSIEAYGKYWNALEPKQ